MKQFAISFIAIACISAMALAGQSKDEKHKSSEAKSMKVTGEVVDVSCYLAHGDGGKGDKHMECAQACAKNGGPLGILTKDGKLYVSVLPDDHKTGPNAILMDHVSHMVTATGVVRSKGGTNGIMITNVEMADAAKK
jgi:type 1 fimbria pilin